MNRLISLVVTIAMAVLLSAISVSLVLADSTPSLTVYPESGHVGTVITLTGAGFKIGGSAEVRYDEKVIATGTIDPRGTLAVIFKAPASRWGDHVITATQGGIVQKGTFRIEAQALDAPVLSAPAPGKKANSFHWKDVTSPNAPVTYSFQVARDRDFNTVLIDREGLSASGYTLNKEEDEILGSNGAYYWRVKAKDAAQDESAWSVGRDFYAGTAGCSLPAWGIWVLIGIGGILVFVLGVRVGRKS